MKIGVVAAVLLLFVLPVYGQTQAPLTYDEVLGMLRAGWPAASVVTEIGRRKCTGLPSEESVAPLLKFAGGAQVVAAMTGRNSPLPAAQPAAPALASSIYINLHAGTLSTQSEIQSLWETSWGSYSREYHRSQAVAIEVANRRSMPVQVRLRVVFVARTLAGNRRFFYSINEEALPIGGNRETKIKAICPPMLGKDTKLVLARERTLEGSQLEGWIVQVLTEPERRLVASAASTGPLEEIAKMANVEAFQAALREFVESHRQSSRNAPPAVFRSTSF